MFLKTILFEKYKIILISACLFSVFVYWLHIINNERLLTALLGFAKNQIEHILRGKIRVYSFRCVFSKFLIEFLLSIFVVLFVVYICCSNPIKK